jgi:Protein of unknown function (DUF3558)
MATLLGCAACLTVLTACGGESTAGEPVADDPPAQESAAEDPPDSESEAAPDQYTVADLCGLLEPEEATGMGGGAEGETRYSTTNGAELCGWSGDMYLVVGLQQDANLEGITSGPDREVSPTEVAGVPAKRKLTPSLDTCEILIDLDSNLFFASAGPLSAGEGKYDSCTVADELASITVPRVTDD